MIDFPNAPAVGQIFVSGTLSWRWDGAKWVATTSEAADYVLFVPVTGETLDVPNVEKVILNPPSPIGTLTLRLPAAADKQAYRISARQRIDALTITAQGGNAVDWTTNELPKDGIVGLTLVQSLATWVRA